MNPPPDKKRRTAGNDDNLWDDDVDDLLLTQENIDTLMQSQVIGPVDPVSNSTSNRGSETNLHKPVTAVRTLGKGTVKSKSSNDLVTQSYSAVCEGRTGFSHVTTAGPSPGADVVQLKAEIARLHKQLSDMQMTSQGRIKILQEKLSQRESEIQKIRQDKLDQLNQFTKDQTEKERSWQEKVDKLKLELQFTKHELNEAMQKQLYARKTIPPKPAVQASANDGKQGYDFSVDFTSSPKTNTSRSKKDAMLQVSLSSDTNSSAPPEPCFKLNVNRSKGHVSGSFLIHKLVQLQLPLNQSNQKQVSTGSRLTETTNKSQLESAQASLETISSSYLSSDSSALGSAYMRLQQTNALLMRTMSCLHQNNRSVPQQKGLLHSDTDLATFLLPTVAESIGIYTSVLSSLQFSVTGQSGSMSSTADSTPSLDTLASSDSSLPRGFSARYIQVMGQQVYTALRILKMLVAYSIPVRKMLVQQVCPDLATSQTQDGTNTENRCLERNGCQLLKKLCHLANHKVYDNVNSNLQLCILTLDILTMTLNSCSASQLERLLEHLPICDVILACLSEDIEDVVIRFRLGCGTLQLVRTLVRSERVIRMLCTKSVDCIFYNVYSFCVQSLNDQPLCQSIIHEYKFVQILAGILTHGRATSSMLTSVDCNCGEAANHLLSILHHIYLSGVYQDSPKSLTLLHQGSSLLQNLASLDKDFIQNHENNYQYVEFVYGMDNLYKTLLDGTEPVTQDLLLELRHDFYGDDEDMDESHELNPNVYTPKPDRPGTSKIPARDTDVFSADPASHSTPKQGASEQRPVMIMDTNNSSQFRQGKKLKLSVNKQS